MCSQYVYAFRICMHVSTYKYTYKYMIYTNGISYVYYHISTTSRAEMFILISWNPNLFAGAIGYITHATWSTILTQSRPSKRGKGNKPRIRFAGFRVGEKLDHEFHSLSLLPTVASSHQPRGLALRYCDSSHTKIFFRRKKFSQVKALSIKKKTCVFSLNLEQQQA